MYLVWVLGSFLSRDIAFLSTRIINSSGSAALAVDAVFYAITASSYYEFLLALDMPGTIEASFSKECSVPKYLARHNRSDHRSRCSPAMCLNQPYQIQSAGNHLA